MNMQNNTICLFYPVLIFNNCFAYSSQQMIQWLIVAMMNMQNISTFFCFAIHRYHQLSKWMMITYFIVIIDENNQDINKLNCFVYRKLIPSLNLPSMIPMKHQPIVNYYPFLQYNQLLDMFHLYWNRLILISHAIVNCTLHFFIASQNALW